MSLTKGRIGRGGHVEREDLTERRWGKARQIRSRKWASLTVVTESCPLPAPSPTTCVQHGHVPVN